MHRLNKLLKVDYIIILTLPSDRHKSHSYNLAYVHLLYDYKQ